MLTLLCVFLELFTQTYIENSARKIDKKLITIAWLLGERWFSTWDKFSMNAIEWKESKGERMGKGFLFLIAQFLSQCTPKSSLSGHGVLSAPSLLALLPKFGPSGLSMHSASQAPSSRRNSMEDSLVTRRLLTYLNYYLYVLFFEKI